MIRTRPLQSPSNDLNYVDTWLQSTPVQTITNEYVGSNTTQENFLYGIEKSYVCIIYYTYILYIYYKHYTYYRILKSKGFNTRLPGKIQLQPIISVTIYSLTPAIRNQILNYKETIRSIILDDEISFSSSARTWDCERSTFMMKIMETLNLKVF